MPAEGAPVGGQILFMEIIWPAVCEPHQRYSTHDPSLCLSVSLFFYFQTHLLPIYSTSSLPNLPLQSIALSFLPRCLFSSFSPSKNILLINAWQLQGAVLLHFFHGNGLSVSADPISVLVATCSFSNTEHIHVLNRRNYYRIPEIEAPSSSLALIIRAQREHGEREMSG